MYQVTLTELYTKRYITKPSTITKEHWCDGFSWSCLKQEKRYNAFVYVNACEAIYSSDNKVMISAKPGDLLYIPTGSKYSCIFQNCDMTSEYRGIDIGFWLMDEMGEQLILSDKMIKLNEFCGPNILRQVEELHRLFNMPEKPFTCICAKLELMIHEMALLSKQKGKISPNFKSIAKGIDYMERDPEQTLSIAEVAAMCPVSSSCFNRLFKEYSGMTPIEYRYTKKIEQAKALLLSGVESVKSVAYALNFETPSYFCRMFKKKTGMTPLAYRNKILKK